MNNFSTVIQTNDIWSMVHVFVPAVLAIYTPSIWKFLTILYVFESCEFLVSQIPGFDYWGEVGFDSKVIDIVMGLLGYALIYSLGPRHFAPGTDQSKFAVLCPTEKSSELYKTLVGPLHVVLASLSTVWTVMAGEFDWMPTELYYNWVVFGVLYLLWAVLFGLERWAIVAVCPIVIISLVSLSIGHTAVVAFVTSVLGLVVLHWVKPPSPVQKDTLPISLEQNKKMYQHNYNLMF
jgi:hypothetical protein